MSTFYCDHRLVSNRANILRQAKRVMIICRFMDNPTASNGVSNRRRDHCCRPTFAQGGPLGESRKQRDYSFAYVRLLALTGLVN
jgi:hypothetical protein